MFNRFAAVAMLVGIVSLAAACGASEPTQAPTPTAAPSMLTPQAPSSTATPWTLSAQEAAAIDDNINSVIDIARTRMAALSTAHFSIDVEGQGSKLEFDVRFPYEVRGVMTGSGDPEEVGLLLTKGKAFTGDPKGSCWSEMSLPFGIVAVYGLNVVSPILQAQLDLAESILNLEQAPDETAEAFYHFRFDIDWPLWFTLWVQGLDQAAGEETANRMYPTFRESPEAMLSGGLQGTAYKGEAWIDKETLRRPFPLEASLHSDRTPSVYLDRDGVALRRSGPHATRQKWLRKSEQGDKWNRCLIEGMIVLSETGARDEQTTPP